MTLRLLLAAFLLIWLVRCSAPSPSHPIQLRDFFATPGKRGFNAAVYGTMENVGDRPDTLDRIETAVAAQVELHRSREIDGVVAMEPVPGPVVLAPDAPLRLRPGSYHLMLLDLQRDCFPGDTIVLTLKFRRSPSQRLSVPVRGAR